MKSLDDRPKVTTYDTALFVKDSKEEVGADEPPAFISDSLIQFKSRLMSGIERDPGSPSEIQKDAIGDMETRQPVEKAALISVNPIPTECDTVLDSHGMIYSWGLKGWSEKTFFWTSR